MIVPDNEDGVLFALVQRLERQRLPRLLDIKAKLDGGEKLADFDLRFLQEVMSDSLNISEVIQRHPEYRELAAKTVDLYREISAKALAQESDGA